MSQAGAELLELAMGNWIASAVLVAAELGVADALGEDPRTADAIAGDVGADGDSLRRLLRGLAARGVFEETAAGAFVHTARSRALRGDAPGNLRALVRLFGLRSTREAALEYEHAIRTGGSAFERAHGTSDPFEVLAGRPAEARIYHDGMSVEASAFPSIARRLDVVGVTTLVDVGGGRGGFLAAVLAQHPTLRGVLFDLPAVVADAPATLGAVATRCEIVPGDLRADVPAGDGYVLKNVLHGWPDPDCAALLGRVRARARAGARVFVIENLMPEGNAPAPCKTFDLVLLLGGRRSRVRSERELGALLSGAGITLRRVVPLFANQAIVEAVIA